MVDYSKSDNDNVRNIFINGGSKFSISLSDFIKQYLDSFPYGEIIFNSIDQDGTGRGFDLKLAERISKRIYIPYIINGGFGKLSHFDEVLNYCEPSGLAIGSLLHYGIKTNNLFSNNDEGNKDFINKNKKYFNFGELDLRKIKDYLKSKVPIRVI